MIIETLSILAVSAALIYRFGRPYLAKRRTKNSAAWPEAEATIQSARMEPAESVGHLRQELPFFSFSYVVEGEYYSGRFGVRVKEDRASTMVREWVDTKIIVRYDPQRPSIFSLSDELSIDGFRVNTVPETDLVSQH